MRTVMRATIHTMIMRITIRTITRTTIHMIMRTTIRTMQRSEK